MSTERDTVGGFAPHLGDAKTTAVVSAATVAVAMPAFLVGASGALLRVDLGFDQAGLGLAISIFFGASAGAAVLGGRWSERLGAGRTLALTTVGSAGVLLGLATIPQNFIHLAVLLAVGGAINGAAQPAASLALARGALERPGLMFGVKQSAVPMTSLMAGASVPLLGVAFGWRVAFVVAALLAAVVAIVVPWQPSQSKRVASQTSRREGDAGTAPLVALSIAAGVATAAAFTLPAFLVESAVENGMSVGNAGWMLVAASSASIGGRLVAGWWVDRGRGALYLMSAMLVAGAGGYAMLAVGGRPGLFLTGALVAYAFGWGWTGLLMYAIVRLNPNAPGLATGIVLTGLATGAAVGPFAFGVVVTTWGFDAAWVLAGGASVASAGLLLAARYWVVLDRRHR